jgi:hypothetical protein
VVGARAEYVNLTRVRQGCSRDQVHQYFSRRPIESEKRHCLAWSQRKVIDAQRAQRPIRFADSSELNRRPGRIHMFIEATLHAGQNRARCQAGG